MRQNIYDQENVWTSTGICEKAKRKENRLRAELTLLLRSLRTIQMNVMKDYI